MIDAPHKLREAKALMEQCNFNRNDPKQVALYEGIYSLLSEVAKEDTKSDSALLHLCVVLTKFNKRPVAEIIDLATEALRRREGYDAVAHLCKAVSFNLDPDAARAKLSEVQSSIKDKDLKGFVGAFRQKRLPPTGKHSSRVRSRSIDLLCH